MAADRGKDNPLIKAIKQTPPLTIVATRLAFKGPYLELHRATPDGGVAMLNPLLLFAAFDPPVYDPKQINEVVMEVETRAKALDPGPYAPSFTQQKVDFSLNPVFGHASYTQQLDADPIIIRTAVTYDTEDATLASLLGKVQGVGAGLATFNIEVYHPVRETNAIFYPSKGLAGLAAGMKDYDDSHEGPKPLEYFRTPPGILGAMATVGKDEYHMLIAAEKQGRGSEALRKIRSLFLPMPAKAAQ